MTDVLETLANRKAEPERRSTLRREAGHFIAEDLDRATWCNIRDCVEVIGNAGWVGEQAVYRNQGRDTWKYRPKNVKRHACCDEEDAVSRNTPIDPQQNVLPPFGRSFRGSVGGAAAPLIRRRSIATPRGIPVGAPVERRSHLGPAAFEA